MTEWDKLISNQSEPTSTPTRVPSNQPVQNKGEFDKFFEGTGITLEAPKQPKQPTPAEIGAAAGQAAAANVPQKSWWDTASNIAGQTWEGLKFGRELLLQEPKKLYNATVGFTAANILPLLEPTELFTGQKVGTKNLQNELARDIQDLDTELQTNKRIDRSWYERQGNYLSQDLANLVIGIGDKIVGALPKGQSTEEQLKARKSTLEEQLKIEQENSKMTNNLDSVNRIKNELNAVDSQLKFWEEEKRRQQTGQKSQVIENMYADRPDLTPQEKEMKLNLLKYYRNYQKKLQEEEKTGDSLESRLERYGLDLNKDIKEQTKNIYEKYGNPSIYTLKGAIGIPIGNLGSVVEDYGIYVAATAAALRGNFKLAAALTATGTAINGLNEFSTAYYDALDNGATPQQARLVGNLYGISSVAISKFGVSERLMKLKLSKTNIDNIEKSFGKKLFDWTMNKTINGSGEVIEENWQDLTQKFYSQIYKENPDWFEGMDETTFVSFVIGFLLGDGNPKMDEPIIPTADLKKATKLVNNAINTPPDKRTQFQTELVEGKKDAVANTELKRANVTNTPPREIIIDGENVSDRVKNAYAPTTTTTEGFVTPPETKPMVTPETPVTTPTVTPTTTPETKPSVEPTPTKTTVKKEVKPTTAEVKTTSKEVERLNTVKQAAIETTKKQKLISETQRQQSLKGIGMEYAAIQRGLEGKPTSIEFKNEQKRLNSMYVGKQVTYEGKPATVVANPFGNVKIQTPDGKTKVVERAAVQAKEATQQEVLDSIKQNAVRQLESKEQIYKERTQVKEEAPKKKLGEKKVEKKAEPKPKKESRKEVKDLISKQLAEMESGIERYRLGNDMFAVHNLTSENLEYVQSLGGLVMPSIAITTESNPLSGYGEISLIGGDNFIKDGVYLSDAYTPRQPKAQVAINKEKYKKFIEDLQKFKELNVRTNITGFMGSPYGKDKNLVDYEKSLRYAASDDATVLLFLQEVMGVDVNDYDSVKPYLTDYDNIKSASDYNLETQIKFKDWFFNKFEDMSDGFYFETSKGQIKPYTADNLLKEMNKKELRGGEDYYYGASSYRALITPKVTTLKQVKQEKKQIKKVTPKTEKIYDDLQTEMQYLMSSTVRESSWFKGEDENYSNINPFMVRNIAKQVKKGITKSNVEKGLVDAGIKNPSEYLIEKWVNFSQKIIDAPTQYFEVKPRRIVNLNEFRGAVVPNTTKQSIVDYLKENNIAVNFYNESAKPTDPDSRENVIKENFDQIKFREQSNKEYTNRVKTGKLTADDVQEIRNNIERQIDNKASDTISFRQISELNKTERDVLNYFSEKEVDSYKQFVDERKSLGLSFYIPLQNDIKEQKKSAKNNKIQDLVAGSYLYPSIKDAEQFAQDKDKNNLLRVFGGLSQYYTKDTDFKLDSENRFFSEEYTPPLRNLIYQSDLKELLRYSYEREFGTVGQEAVEGARKYLKEVLLDLNNNYEKRFNKKNIYFPNDLTLEKLSNQSELELVDMITNLLYMMPITTENIDLVVDYLTPERTTGKNENFVNTVKRTQKILLEDKFNYDAVGENYKDASGKIAKRYLVVKPVSSQKLVLDSWIKNLKDYKDLEDTVVFSAQNSKVIYDAIKYNNNLLSSISFGVRKHTIPAYFEIGDRDVTLLFNKDFVDKYPVWGADTYTNIYPYDAKWDRPLSSRQIKSYKFLKENIEQFEKTFNKKFNETKLTNRFSDVVKINKIGDGFGFEFNQENKFHKDPRLVKQVITEKIIDDGLITEKDADFNYEIYRLVKDDIDLIKNSELVKTKNNGYLVKFNNGRTKDGRNFLGDWTYESHIYGSLLSKLMFFAKNRVNFDNFEFNSDGVDNYKEVRTYFDYKKPEENNLMLLDDAVTMINRNYVQRSVVPETYNFFEAMKVVKPEDFFRVIDNKMGSFLVDGITVGKEAYEEFMGARAFREAVDSDPTNKFFVDSLGNVISNTPEDINKFISEKGMFYDSWSKFGILNFDPFSSGNDEYEESYAIKKWVEHRATDPIKSAKELKEKGILIKKPNKNFVKEVSDASISLKFALRRFYRIMSYPLRMDLIKYPTKFLYNRWGTGTRKLTDYTRLEDGEKMSFQAFKFLNLASKNSDSLEHIEKSFLSLFKKQYKINTVEDFAKYLHDKGDIVSEEIFISNFKDFIQEMKNSIRQAKDIQRTYAEGKTNEVIDLKKDVVGILVREPNRDEEKLQTIIDWAKQNGLKVETYGSNFDGSANKSAVTDYKDKMLDVYDGYYFRLADKLEPIVGYKISDKQEKELRAWVEKHFGKKVSVELVVKIMANREALGAYRKTLIQISEEKATTPKEVWRSLYHEAFHAYADIFLTREEKINLFTDVAMHTGLRELYAIEEYLAENTDFKNGKFGFAGGFVKYAESRQGLIGKIRLMLDKFFVRVADYFKLDTGAIKVYSEILTPAEVKEKKISKLGQKQAAQAPPEKKKLGAKKMPIVETPAETVGGGRVKKSRFMERLNEQLLGSNPEAFGFNDTDGTYNRANLEKESEKALNFIEADPMRALNIALGNEKVPAGYLENTIAVAVALRLEQLGNLDLYKQVIIRNSLQNTRRGQEIASLRGNFNDNSPANYIKRALDARLNKLGDKFAGGLGQRIGMLTKKSNKGKVIERIQKEKVELKKVVKDSKKIKSAQDIIDSLRC